MQAESAAELHGEHVPAHVEFTAVVDLNPEPHGELQLTAEANVLIGVQRSTPDTVAAGVPLAANEWMRVRTRGRSQ